MVAQTLLFYGEGYNFDSVQRPTLNNNTFDTKSNSLLHKTFYVHFH